MFLLCYFGLPTFKKFCIWHRSYTLCSTQSKMTYISTSQPKLKSMIKIWFCRSDALRFITAWNAGFPNCLKCRISQLQEFQSLSATPNDCNLVSLETTRKKHLSHFMCQVVNYYTLKNLLIHITRTPYKVKIWDGDLYDSIAFGWYYSGFTSCSRVAPKF